MKAFVLDANVVLRFLTQDHPALSKAATAFFEKARNKQIELELDPVVLAEVVYTLESYYKTARVDTANTLLRFVASPGIEVEQSSRVINALLRYKNQPVSFPDAWLAAICAEKKKPAASFDRDLDRFADVVRVEPK